MALVDFEVLPAPEAPLDDGFIEEVAKEVAEEVAELLEGVEEAISMTIEPLPFGEWFNRALDVCFDTVSWCMSTPYFRFFAVFSLFLVACNLCARFLRTGRGLAQ